MTPFKLSEFEAQSQVWVKLEKQLTERLATLREKNDGALDLPETARLRGRIEQIKEILAWAVKIQPID